MRLRSIAFTSVVGLERDLLIGQVAPLMPIEFSERCDLCGRQLAALNVHFDGRQFLCPACRVHRAATPESP
jgi:hypothetical protein